MGVYIHLLISGAVTQKEWESVYEETLQLVNKLPFAESDRIKIHGIETYCLVPTIESSFYDYWSYGKNDIGWRTTGDYEHMATAEDYFLPRCLVRGEVNEDAGDAMLEALPVYLNYDWRDAKYSNSYRPWGNKTQGEPYHIYLLAVAALIEARLGDKAFTYGDITREEFEEAVEIANECLENPIELPDRCDMERLMRRVKKLPLTEKEMVEVFCEFYLGTKDDKFGEVIRQYISEDTIAAYWENRFEEVEIGAFRFHRTFNEYMIWGFDLRKLCEYVYFYDSKGNSNYDAFVKRVMDAKMHIQDKKYRNLLKMNYENKDVYNVYELLTEFVFGGMDNKIIDRYIPLDDIRTILIEAIGDKCDVNGLVDTYIAEENELIKKKIKKIHDVSEELEKAFEDDGSEEFFRNLCMNKKEDIYDITEYEDLIFYEKGDLLPNDMKKALAMFRDYIDSLYEHEKDKEIMYASTREKYKWLVDRNMYIKIRDVDWQRIYTDIEHHPESFRRYYSIFRVDMSHYGIKDICRPLIVNDDLYVYSKELAMDPEYAPKSE